MWEADFRTGPGVLVTLDGIYNQGNFSQNKLIVCTLSQLYENFVLFIVVCDSVLCSDID